MSIEEAIKTKAFSNSWHKVSVNIIYTNNWLEEQLENRARKEEITVKQFNVLRILRGQYPIPVSNGILKERMLSKTPDISRLVDRLVQKGLISRCKKQSDKRAVELLLTDKGFKLLESLEEDMLLLDLLPSHLSTEECEQLSNLLDKLRGPATFK